MRQGCLQTEKLRRRRDPSLMNDEGRIIEEMPDLPLVCQLHRGKNDLTFNWR